MKIYIQQCDGVDCLADNIPKIPVYECLACAQADLALCCFKTGQRVSTLSRSDSVPLTGDALRVYTGAQQAGTIPVVGTVTNAYNSVYQSPMVWNPTTQFFCAPNICVSNVVEATCNIQSDVIAAYSALVVNNATITFNGTDNCPWDFNDGDITYNGTSIIPDVSNYATTTDVSNAESCACSYACCIAECCGSCYFEGCFADCFACCIAEWWDCHRGEVETTAQTDNNRLWIV